MLNFIKDAFRTAKEKIRAKIQARLQKLPPLSDIIRQRHVFIAALRDLGDEFTALEPGDLAKIEWLAQAADAAQFVADVSDGIPGLEKLDDVHKAFMLAWKGLELADDKADKFWDLRARPFIDRYVKNAKRDGYYKAS